MTHYGVRLMYAGRSLSTRRKLCVGSFSGQWLSIFMEIHCFDRFHGSYSPFFETETLSSAPLIFQWTMSSTNEILPNFISASQHGCARGCACGFAQVRARARQQSFRDTKRALFSTLLRSNAGKVIWSSPRNNVMPFENAPLCKCRSFNRCNLLQLPLVISLR